MTINWNGSSGKQEHSTRYHAARYRTNPVSSTNITEHHNKGKIMYNKEIWQKKTTQEETNRAGEQERASRLALYSKKKAKKK